MQLENGLIYDGVVKRVTEYGAFVEISDDQQQQSVTGMVHISEVANTFVRDIHEFLKENDTVRVKMIGTNPQGKISLSIKAALAEEDTQQPIKPKRQQRDAKPYVYEPKKVVSQSEMSFEDKLLHFKQESEEKIFDLKRGSERRGGSRSRRAK
ncbi:MAG: S1 RNA-binding domain-containing protein [Oscillospiraceae bacterium]|nr:S1 RNA-binding domain-containing protein [Oscillospiraceae bacterium]